MAALVEQLNDLHHVIDVKSVQILNADQAAPENIFKLSVRLGVLTTTSLPTCFQVIVSIHRMMPDTFAAIATPSC